MSTDLLVTTDRPFDPTALGLEGLAWSVHGDEHRLHVKGLSTRVTTVRREGSDLRIGIRALAAEADVDLAIAVAASFGAPVHVEGHPVAAGELAAFFDAAWRARAAEAGGRALQAILQQSGGPLQAPGPVRTFAFGPRLLAELDGPDLGARAIERMRAVQWDVPARFRDAGVFVSGEGRDAPTFAVWIGGEDLVLPPVRFLALDTGDAPIVVPASFGPELAGARGRLLDEAQLAVDAFSAEGWRAVLERARALARD